MPTPNPADILTPDLAEYAAMLADNGFRVYVFTSDVARVAKGGKKACATSLGFSRIVDGDECRASVSTTYFGRPQFSMPIKPSRQHGSAMFIGGDSAPEDDGLTLYNAELYASPTGTNRLVGTHKNHHAGFAHRYTEIHP